MLSPRLLTPWCLVALSLGLCQEVQAEPVLQLYLEGATYDYETETWVKTYASDGSDMETIRLWAIGHTGRVGAAIVEVKLAIAYQSAFDPLEFVLTPSVTGHPLFEDYSTPVAPWLKYFDDDYAVHTDGSTPTLSDGTHLPPHGVYGEGVYWQEFELGDFDNKNPSDDERYGDSPIADFIGDVPESTTTMGQINVYEIEVISSTGNLHDLTLHFDLYNHVEGAPRAKSKFAPFSHTADAEGTFAPSPTTLTGLLSMAVVGLFRRRRRARNDAGR